MHAHYSFLTPPPTPSLSISLSLCVCLSLSFSVPFLHARLHTNMHTVQNRVGRCKSRKRAISKKRAQSQRSVIARTKDPQEVAGSIEQETVVCAYSSANGDCKRNSMSTYCERHTCPKCSSKKASSQDYCEKCIAKSGGSVRVCSFPHGRPCALVFHSRV